MRKSLEPKEAQIEKLKTELFNLEQEFEKMLKQSKIQVKREVEQKKKIEELAIKLEQEKYTTHQQNVTLNELIMDVSKVVHLKDTNKDKIQKMGNIYLKYAKQGLKGVTKSYDLKGMNELMRQKVHLKKSLVEMNLSTSKLVKRRQKDIFTRTLENSKLIYDLNMLRAKNKKHENKISKVSTEINKLKRDRDQIIKNVQQSEKKLEKWKRDQQEERSQITVSMEGSRMKQHFRRQESYGQMSKSI